MKFIRLICNSRSGSDGLGFIKDKTFLLNKLKIEDFNLFNGLGKININLFFPTKGIKMNL